MKKKLLAIILTIVLIGGLVSIYYILQIVPPSSVGTQSNPLALLPATVGPQPIPPTPLPTAVNLKNYLIVAPSGGNFTRLSDALKSITDASAVNRYTIIVRGLIVENGNQSGVDGVINAKSHVDVIGQGATLEMWTPLFDEVAAKDYTIQFLDVFDSEWRDLNIIIKESWNQTHYEYTGDNSTPLVDIGIGTEYPISFRGKTDRTCRLVNIRLSWDWQAGTKWQNPAA